MTDRDLNRDRLRTLLIEVDELLDLTVSLPREIAFPIREAAYEMKRVIDREDTDLCDFKESTL